MVRRAARGRGRCDSIFGTRDPLTPVALPKVLGDSKAGGLSAAAYGDRVGGVLRIETRDGSRDTTTVRTSLGAAGASLVAEGPIGRSGLSWLLGARKSFLDYVVRALDDEPSFVVGYHDVQAKLTHRSARGSLNLFLAAGDSTFRDEGPGQRRNDVARAAAGARLAALRWRRTPSSQTSITLSAFFTRETGLNRNLQSEALLDSAADQTGGRLDLTREFGGAHSLQTGLEVRRLGARTADTRYPRSGPAQDRHAFDKSHWRHGAYAQDTWRTPEARVTITAGVRTDHSTTPERAVLLPRLSGVLRLNEKTSLSFAGGGYAQFPTLEQSFGRGGTTTLIAERSDHYQVAVEHALSSATRLRMDVYGQIERNGLSTAPEIRRGMGQVVLPMEAALMNSWSGHSRGVDLVLQRRSPNGLTGWLSYGVGRTRVTDAQTGQTFDSDHDQRHTVNAYASYRLSHRTNFSMKYRFGTGSPVAGYFEEEQRR